jgi:hypothetical protein
MEPVALSRTPRGRELFVPAVGGWDGFDRLRAFLVKHYAATVLETIDGPDARICRLQLGDCELTIEFDDPYGNAIVCRDDDCPVFDEIACDLRARLAGEST